MLLNQTRGRQGLTRNTLRSICPAVFAPVPHSNRSDKYAFVNTESVLDTLEDEGFVPVLANQQRVRKEDRFGYQKHLIRFSRIEDLFMPDGERPEILLVNSHDGTSSFQLHAGFYRFACSNGLIVSDGEFARIRLLHKNFTPDGIMTAVHEIVKNIPRLTESINRMKAVKLNDFERFEFARRALTLKYEEGKAPITPERLLAVRRFGDGENNLWMNYNIVQENLIKGGQMGCQFVNGSYQRCRTRQVTSIDKNVQINKGIWNLADEFCKMKLVA